MGTTADKLNKILETKQAIRQAIITKGVDVGEDTKFADYPSRIAAIQTGSGEGTGGASDAFFNMRTQNGTDFNNLFYSYTGSELDLSGLDTSQVATMNDMFSYCTSLASLNLSNWDTSSVTNMYNMFNSCSALSSLDLSHFNTSNVADMSYMFNYCTGLASLNLNNWDTRNVTNMNGMFYSCSNLQSLDLSSFDTSNVSSMNAMFNNCPNLAELNISGFNTSNVNDMNGMFSYCYNLKSLDLSHFNTNNVTNIDNMFSWCTSLEELDIRNFNVNNIEYINCMFEGCSDLHKLRLDNCNYDTINKIINSAGFPTGQVNVDGEYINRTMYVQEANIAGLMAPDGWEFVYVESSEGGEPGLPTPGMPGIGGGDEPEGPTITPDPDPSEPGGGEVGPVIPPEGPEEEPTETYQVNFSAYNGTGGNAKKLTVNNVDVSDQVVEVNRFEDTCSYRYETTEPITQVSFKDNTDLIRLFSLDSSNITDMSEMFDGCTSFVGIVSYIDCGAVTNMNYMFRNCTSLSSIPDSYFTSMANVTDMTGMYYNCSNMTGTVEASKYWNNAMVGGFAGCFYNCTSLDNYSEIPFDWGGPDDSE